MGLLLAEGLALFAACLMVHALVWRVKRPASYRQWLPALVVIFGPLAAGAAWYAVPVRLELIAVLLLHFSLSTAYIIGYTLIGASSPSVELLKLLDRAPNGLPLDALQLPFLAGALTGDRIGNLEGAGLATIEHGQLVLGPRGHRITSIMLLYRHAVGLRDGGGG
jgi:hypothetical protein